MDWNETVSVEIDVASDLRNARIWAVDRGLDIEVVEECGPAGGNPLVKISGSRGAVIAALWEGEYEFENFDNLTGRA